MPLAAPGAVGLPSTVGHARTAPGAIKLRGAEHRGGIMAAPPLKIGAVGAASYSPAEAGVAFCPHEGTPDR